MIRLRGGAGMVMRPDVVDAAIRGAEAKHGKPARKIYLSPRGRVFDQALAKELAQAPSLLLLCGRFEGVDQRVIDSQRPIGGRVEASHQVGGLA